MSSSADPSHPVNTRKRGARGEVREALIRCGTELCTERGFQVTGIDEVLKRVGVPKGSFYYYFESKHQFGEAVIENYARYFQRKLDRILDDPSHSPLTRVQNFVMEAERGMAKFDFQRGCLVGNLGQELGGLDDKYRRQLEAVLLSWQRATAACLRAAAADGEIACSDAEADRLAAFFWVGWEGAILRAKLTRNSDPLRLFGSFFFELLKSRKDV